ncbi:MAG: peptidoglycan recognition family protein [Verrucomicrobiota bacterium]
MNSFPRIVLILLTVTPAILFSGCATRPGTISERKGDEIIVAGKFIHTGTRVVTWMDPGGYDAYRTERRFAPFEESDYATSKEKIKELSSPARYNLRKGDPKHPRPTDLTTNEIEQVRGGGWDLPMLQNIVDQFVLHFDVCGISRQCFKVLHDHRGLSVHFMLDVDGTVYQTLDLKERAFHATTSNTRSIGIEIANMGAYGTKTNETFEKWYKREPDGETTLIFQDWLKPESILTPNFVGHPARSEPVFGEVQGTQLWQYDYTPKQYAALVKLTATLCKTFPKMKCDYPRDAEGKLITKKLPDEELNNYGGVLGHYHVQTNKTDPGPALQWDYLIKNAQRLVDPSNSPNKEARLDRENQSPKKLEAAGGGTH